MVEGMLLCGLLFRSEPQRDTENHGADIPLDWKDIANRLSRGNVKQICGRERWRKEKKCICHVSSHFLFPMSKVHHPESSLPTSQTPGTPLDGYSESLILHPVKQHFTQAGSDRGQKACLRSGNQKGGPPFPRRWLVILREWDHMGPSRGWSHAVQLRWAEWRRV